MALDTVQDYVDRARVLLLDEVDPYRYALADLIEALNMALMEIRRLRPDAVQSYIRTTPPSYTTSDLATTVPIDVQYRTAVVYYIVGNSHLRDEENTQSERAAAFLNKFVSQFTSIQA